MSKSTPKQALPTGYELNGYRLLDVLGIGGFGVTYRAEHVTLGHRVAIKEYLPNEFAVREGSTVFPKSESDEEDFHWGLARFLNEATTLAKFAHRNLVRVRDYFEANQTAYIVMDYEEGESLDRLLAEHGTLNESQLRRILLPIVEGLREVHQAGFLHRDIKPSNIFVRRSDESPVLLDFGAARQALGRKSKSLTAVASAGYSPPEQYESEGEQGPWTDIYALSALCYRAITGNAPVEAPRRQSQLLRGRVDPLPPLPDSVDDKAYSAPLLQAVDAGLRVIETERPASLDQWSGFLTGRAGQPAPTIHGRDIGAEQLRDRAGTRRGRAGGVIAGIVVVGFALGAGYYFWIALENAPPDSVTMTEPAATREQAESPDSEESTSSSILGGAAILVVETEPPGAEVVLADQVVGTTPLRMSNLRAGTYTVILQHPHYEAVRMDNQSLSDGEVLRIEREFVPATGQLTVITQPETAWVERDGERLAHNTPVTLEGLPAGAVELTLGAEAYRSVTVTAEVPRNGVGRLELTLQPIPYGTLTLELDPADASVILPDIRPAYTPGLRLPEGKYRVRVSRAGYQESTRTVEVVGETHVQVELARQSYPFTVVPVPETASIQFVDDIGEYRDAILLPPGSYKIRVSAPGFDTLEDTVIHGTTDTRYNIELSRQPQPLTILAVPMDASVVVLGISEDYHDGVLLPPRAYRVLVSAPGYESAELTIQHGTQPSQVSVELRRSTFMDRIGSVARGPEMVTIPAGVFRMGCVSGQRCSDQEEPVHEVRIARPFAISKYEVTFADWQTCLDGGGCNGYSPEDSGWGRADRPVINVSWNDAQAYLSWLSQETGEQYRLPSEAEWEYAARAGAATAYTWGNRIGRNLANCQGCRSQWDNDQTAPVGSFPENAFGLHDMHGNVWEWVQDCWNGSYEGAPTDGRAWLSGICLFRVLRGGAWNTQTKSVRSAHRMASATTVQAYGFRVARTLDP